MGCGMSQYEKMECAAIKRLTTKDLHVLCDDRTAKLSAEETTVWVGDIPRECTTGPVGAEGTSLCDFVFDQASWNHAPPGLDTHIYSSAPRRIHPTTHILLSAPMAMCCTCCCCCSIQIYGYGDVLSSTVRVKEGSKSWALITFEASLNLRYVEAYNEKSALGILY
jgi:hypothetical protein